MLSQRSRGGFRFILALAAVCCCASKLLAQVAGEERPQGAALDRRADLSFKNAHLQDVVQTLRRDFNIDIRLDERALESINIQPDKAVVLQQHKLRMERAAEQLAANLLGSEVQLAPDADILKRIRELPYPGFTFQQSDITLRSALYHLLADLDPTLTFVVQNNIVWITTSEEADGKTEVRVYPVGEELAVAPTAPSAQTPFDAIPEQEEVARFDYEPLLDILHKTIAPVSWDHDGGNGSAHASDGSLTITQTSQNHELVAGLLAALGQVRAEMRKAKPQYLPIPVGASAGVAQREATIGAALGRPAAFDYQKVALADVAADISKRFGLPVRLDRNALEGLNIKPSHPVTFQQQNVPLRAGLEMMLQQIDPTLTYSISHEVLRITTREEAANSPRIVVYPVRDIISATVTAADASKRPDLWDFQTLVNNIQKSIGPTSWDDDGGSGSIAVDHVAGALVISQAEGEQHKVAKLIEDLRKIAQGRPKVEKPQPDAKKDADPYVTVVFRLWQPYAEKAVAKEEDLMKVVREMVQPKTWDAPEVQVRTLPSRLIIRQRASVQRQIYAALQSLAVLKPEEAPAEPAKGGFSGFGGRASGGGFGGIGGGGGLGGQSNGGFQGAGALPAAGN